MGRVGRLLAAAGLVLAGACTESPTPEAEPDRDNSATPLATVTPAEPAMALSYEAEEAGASEGLIGQAQQALRDHPDEPTAYAALASAFMRRARETSRDVYRTYARDVLAAAHDRFAGDTDLRTLSALLLLDEHRFEAAAKEGRLLAAARANDPTPRLIIGDAMLELGRYEEATDAYQEAIDLRPDLRSYNRAAYMRWLFGDFEGARQVMELAIDSGSFRDPESIAWCFSDLSVMYLSSGDLGRAEAAKDRALELVDGYVPALVIEARIEGRRGRHEQAITAVHAALQARPSAAEYLLLAELQEARGDHESAREAVDKAERLASHDPRPLAHYLARRGEQPARALELAERELGARQNIQAWDTYALALLRAGEPSKAAGAIAKATRLGTADASMVLHRGLIEHAQGNAAAARASLDEALRLDPGVDPRMVAELRMRLGAA